MSRARDLGSSINSTAAGKNLIINGGMDFFQRGSLSSTGDGYGLDRWWKSSGGSSTNVSVTQQSTGVPAGSRYCMRVTMTGANGYGNQYQVIETSNVAALQGKTITISAKLRRSSGYAGNLTLTLEKSSTVDAGIAGSYTTIASQGVTNALLPTGTTSNDWYLVQLTTVIPNDGTANTLKVGLSQSQTESSCYWEVSQIQLEVGSVATSFSRSGGDLAGELLRCQRYYYTSTMNKHLGSCRDSGLAFLSKDFPVQMRSTPSFSSTVSTKVSGGAFPGTVGQVGFYGDGWIATNGATLACASDGATPDTGAFYIQGFAVTTGKIFSIQTNDLTNFIWSAEL